MCTNTCMWLQACGERLGINLGVFTSCHMTFWDSNSHWAWSSTASLDGLAHVLRTLLSLSPQAGIAAVCWHSWLALGVGDQKSDPWDHTEKSFICWAISPVLLRGRFLFKLVYLFNLSGERSTRERKSEGKISGVSFLPSSELRILRSGHQVWQQTFT